MIENIKDIKPIYPTEPWKITEPAFKPENNYRNETVFVLSNGYIGMRGTFEEGYKLPKGLGMEGSFVNGFYESETIRYGETAYGFADKTQTMLNVANAKIIRLSVDGEEFSLFEGKLDEAKRVLDMKAGTLSRFVRWTSPKGKTVEIRSTRLVSLTNKYAAAIEYAVTPIDFDGEIVLISLIDGDVENNTKENNSRIDYGPYGRVVLPVDRRCEGAFSALRQKSKNTAIGIVTAMRNEIDFDAARENTDDEFTVSTRFAFKARRGKTYTLTKYITYVTTRDFPEEKLYDAAKTVLSDLSREGFAALAAAQKKYLDEFWENADIEIDGDDLLSQGLRWHEFALLQSPGRDGKTSLGAKGLSGEGYEGHVFWDTEMYVTPFFNFERPEIAKQILMFRYNTLDQARERARVLSVKRGCCFPWRTINGREASAFFLAGTCQFHINADIAYAVHQYVTATGDDGFLADYGAEILVETARFWVEFGEYIDYKGGKFCYNGVTGPDEFAVLVNNNCYTNMMARENMKYAVEAVAFLKEKMPDKYAALAKKIDLADEEPAEWQRAIDNTYIPYDETRGIYPQDDSFLSKKRWDIENTPFSEFPLLDKHHPIVVYRHQVSKQADFVLAMFLLSRYFTREEMKRNFDFYETVSVHESSLSACIFSIVADAIGYHDVAYKYFMTTSRLDLDDYHANVNAGYHCANMAGTWMSMVFGFGGMRLDGGELSFAPVLPEKWNSYRFRLLWRGRLLEVKVDQAGAHYRLLRGDALTIKSNGQEITVE